MGLGFEGIYGEIEEMIRRELLHTRMARAIARKAGIKQGTGTGSLTQIIATFSAANSDEGYEISYTESTPFPAPPASLVQADLSDISHARLVANVVAGGSADTVLTASFAGEASEDISVALEYTGDVLTVGAFHPVTASFAGITAMSFTITASSPGSVTVGLVQLQGI